MSGTKIFIAIITLFIANVAQAQTLTTTTEAIKQPIKLKSFQFTTGASWDKYRDMSMEKIADRTQNMPDYKDATKDMRGTPMYSSLGLNTGINLSYSIPKLSNEAVATEWRSGASVTLMKESLIEYDKRTNSGKTSIMYCFVENDLKVGSDILFRLGDESRFTFYTGTGINASTSFGNSLLVFDNYNVETGVINDFSEAGPNTAQNTYVGKSIVYVRAYMPFGVSLKWFRHLETNMEYKAGRGFEQVVGGSASGFKAGEFTVGLRYNMQKNKTLSIFDMF